MKDTQANITNNTGINDDSPRGESISSNGITQSSNTSTTSSIVEDTVILSREEIRTALARLAEDELFDLSGSIKKQAIAGFIQLAKDDSTGALSLFQELMQAGNIAAVELAKHVWKDELIDMQFKLDMKDALKLIEDKLASRRKEIAALDYQASEAAGPQKNQERFMYRNKKQDTKGVMR